ncbi:MAG: TetR/AcrR family transcriptional regulator [Oligoflexus sp.]
MTTENVKFNKREQTKINNRSAILQAARSVFFSQGYEGTTVRDIVRQTNLAPGTFYNYFQDKESIFRAIVDDYLLRLSTAVQSPRSKAFSLNDFIGPAFEVFFTNIAKDPEMFILTGRSEAILQSMYDSSVMEMVIKELLGDIYSAMDQDILPRIDAEYLASAFIGIGYELGKQMIKRKPMNPKATAKFAAGLFIGGIGGIPSAQDMAYEAELSYQH